MIPQIQWTSELSSKHGVKFLVYSRSGAGKTKLIETAPDPFVLSSENGLLSLRKTKLPYVNIKTLADLDNMFMWFAQRQDGSKIKTICVDSMTDIADTIISNELRTQKDPRKAFGEVYTQVMERYKKFRDLEYRHVYFIAQQDVNKDEITGAQTFGPSFPGQKLGQKTPYLFDETFQLIIAKDGTRWVRTRADYQNEAKDRSGALDEFEPANLTSIINKIMA